MLSNILESKVLKVGGKLDMVKLLIFETVLTVMKLNFSILWCQQILGVLIDRHESQTSISSAYIFKKI